MPTDTDNKNKIDSKLQSFDGVTVLRRRVFDASAQDKKPTGRPARGSGRNRKRRSRRPKVVEKAKITNSQDDFGTTWWGRQWLQAVESVSVAFANRLPRGLDYARSGQVSDLSFKPGQVTAKVKGRRSSPYKVVIQLRSLTKPQWKKVSEILADRASFTASLLAGEMPERMTDVFEQCGLALFPKRHKELKTSCSCPDWANPCKHIAATLYMIGDALDRDPFLLMALRGRSREELLSGVRAIRSGEEAQKKNQSGREQYGISVGQIDVKRFFEPSDDLEDYRFHIAIPETSFAPLKRLGAPPDWSLPNTPHDLLQGLYDVVADRAVQLGMQEVNVVAPEFTVGSFLEEDNSPEIDDLDELEDEEDAKRVSPPGAKPALAENTTSSEEEALTEGPTVLVRRSTRQQRNSKKKKPAQQQPQREKAQQTRARAATLRDRAL